MKFMSAQGWTAGTTHVLHCEHAHPVARIVRRLKAVGSGHILVHRHAGVTRVQGVVGDLVIGRGEASRSPSMRIDRVVLLERRSDSRAQQGAGHRETGGTGDHLEAKDRAELWIVEEDLLSSNRFRRQEAPKK